jgi:hypothetical protein
MTRLDFIIRLQRRHEEPVNNEALDIPFSLSALLSIRSAVPKILVEPAAYLRLRLQ